MTIHHHLSDSTLMSYAAGNCSEAVNLAVATHLSQCKHCRVKLRRLEMIGGALLETGSSKAMRENALDKVLARINKSSESNHISASHSLSSNAIANPLDSFLPDGLDNIRWRTVAPGIKTHSLIQSAQEKSTAKLIKIAPGMTIPEHTHSNTELTLVLRGSYSDEIGRFCAGDIADLDQDIKHQPIADTSESCICLIAMDGPLIFNQFVPRMMQLVSGI